MILAPCETGLGTPGEQSSWRALNLLGMNGKRPIFMQSSVPEDVELSTLADGSLMLKGPGGMSPFIYQRVFAQQQAATAKPHDGTVLVAREAVICAVSAIDGAASASGPVCTATPYVPPPPPPPPPQADPAMTLVGQAPCGYIMPM